VGVIPVIPRGRRRRERESPKGEDGRLAQERVMSKSAPSERSLRAAGGKQAELDITLLCEIEDPAAGE